VDGWPLKLGAAQEAMMPSQVNVGERSSLFTRACGLRMNSKIPLGLRKGYILGLLTKSACVQRTCLQSTFFPSKILEITQSGLNETSSGDGGTFMLVFFVLDL
jgi:hypothetical protein